MPCFYPYFKIKKLLVVLGLIQCAMRCLVVVACSTIWLQTIQSTLENKERRPSLSHKMCEMPCYFTRKQLRRLLSQVVFEMTNTSSPDGNVNGQVKIKTLFYKSQNADYSQNLLQLSRDRQWGMSEVHKTKDWLPKLDATTNWARHHATSW